MESRKKIRILYSVIAVLIILLGLISGRRIINRLERRNAASIINQGYYQMKLNTFKAMTKYNNSGNNSIVFLGDSLTDYANFDEILHDSRIRNRGIAGDTTLGVLNRLDEVTDMKPAKLFILIGTNDIACGRSADEIIQSIRQIISRVQTESPDTKIYLQSLFPVNNIKFRTGRPVETIQAVNAGLKILADDLKCVFIDTYPLLLNESENALDVKYTPDGLHFNGAGIVKWAEFLKSYVNE